MNRIRERNKSDFRLFLNDLYNVFCLFCVGFTCAYFLALYNGVDTNLYSLWG